MPTDAGLIRWTYEHSDAVVEGPRAKYEEMERRASDLGRGAPVLLDEEPPEPKEPSVYTCAGTKTDGASCTREVDARGGYCWQHEEQAD